MAGQWKSIGIDWDSGMWVAVGLTEAGSTDAAVFDTIRELWETHGEAAHRIVVDIPIGLCEGHETADGCVETAGELSRECDDLARDVIGPRSSSVFTAPCRPAVNAAANGDDYSAVNELNKDCTGKGLMQQAKNIATGIAEVDEFLQAHDDQAVLLEGHPEVCFRAFAEGPLEYNKNSAPGMAERLGALESATEYGTGEWRSLAENLAEQGHSVGTDDLIDALGLAYTAAAPDSHLHSLPSEPPTDATGLPMQMVYRRSNPFTV